MSYISKNVLGQGYFSACLAFATISSLFGFGGLWLLPERSDLSYTSGILTEITETCYKEKYSCKLHFKLSSDEHTKYIYESFSEVPYQKLKRALKPNQLTDVTLSYDAKNCVEDPRRCWPMDVTVNGHGIVSLDDVLKKERSRAYLSFIFACISTFILIYNERHRAARRKTRRQNQRSN